MGIRAFSFLPSDAVTIPRPTNNMIADTANINNALAQAGPGGVIRAPGMLSQPYLYNGILPIQTKQRLMLNGAQFKQPNQITSTFSAPLTLNINSSTSATAALTDMRGFFVGMFVVLQDNSGLSTGGVLPTFATIGQLVFTTNILQITSIGGVTIPYYSVTGGSAIPGNVGISFTTNSDTGVGTGTYLYKSVAVSNGSYAESSGNVAIVTTTSTSGASTTLTVPANITIAPNMSVTGTNVAANTYVQSINAAGTVITLNQTTSGTVSGNLTIGASYTYQSGVSSCVLASLTQLLDTFPGVRNPSIKDLEFNGNSANQVYGGRWELSPELSSSQSIIEDFYTYNFNGDGLILSGRGSVARNIWIQSPSGGGFHMSAMQYAYTDAKYNSQVISGLNEAAAQNINVNSPGMAGSAYFGHNSGNSAQVSSVNYQVFYNAIQCSNTENDLLIEGFNIYNDYGSVMCCGIGHINYNGNLRLNFNCGEIKGMTNGAFNIANNATGPGLPPEDILIGNTVIYECGPQNSPGTSAGQQQQGGFTNLQRNQISCIGSSSGSDPLANRITLSNVTFVNSPLSIQGALSVSGKTKHICTDINKSCALIIEQCSGPVVGSGVLLDASFEEPLGNPTGATFTQAGNTVSSKTLTLGGTNANIFVGQAVTSSDGGLPVGTYVTAYSGGTSVSVSNSATTTASVTFTFGNARYQWQPQYSTQLHINGSSLTNTDAQINPIQASAATLTNGSSSVTAVNVSLNGASVANLMRVSGQGIPDGIFIQSSSGTYSSGTGAFTLSQYNPSGTIVPWLYTGNSGVYPLLFGTQKLVHVRGKTNHYGGGIHTLVTSGAKVDLDIKSVNPYTNAILHKSYQFRCKYKIDHQNTEGFVPAVGTVFCDFGQDNSNSSTGYGNVDVEINQQACINTNGWGVFGLRVSANNTLPSVFKGLLRGYTTNSATGQIYRPVLYPASIASGAITSKNEFDDLRISSTRAVDQAFAVNVSDIGIPNILGTPTAPTTIVNTAGAGAGGAASIAAGTDNDHQLQVITAGVPGTSSIITVTTFAQPYGQVPLIDMVPANAAAAGLGIGAMPICTATATVITVTSGSTGLTTGTTYIWNISARDISRNNK